MDLMADLLVLLSEISAIDNIILDQKKTVEYSDRLSKIYSNSDFRHSYHEISQTLEEMIPDQWDILEQNLLMILDYVNSVIYNQDVIKKLAKLCDHVSLETIRLQRMAKIKFIGDIVAEENAKMRSENQTMLNELESLREKVEGFHAQSITILGIFSGLVIGFSTGIQLLSSTFANINELNFYKMVLFVLIISLILFNLIFLLMYAVSKISNHSIAGRCKHGKNCDVCRRCNYNISYLVHRYPYVLYFNVIIVICAIILVYQMVANQII